MTLDYIALGLLIFVALVIFYGVIVIHDIPYELAKKRNHPHQDAIHYAGWVSLFTLHVLWPFLWIWATLWREDRGWGFDKIQQEQQSLHHETVLLAQQLELLSEKVAALETQKHAAEALAAPSVQVQSQAPTQVQTSSEEPPADPKPTSGVNLDTAADSTDIPATNNQSQSNNKNEENR
ncbi:DUF3302 domain-containing protein [Shewanella algae]|nr:DUF3302 domain-containing protein [Shewanella algae]MBO2634466.1 DUF3302 domain-containing protein [Shewanella algae]MBO2655455.1 DUF3302 domain-containing protein [Shewanella algae]BCV34100.1 hypothetical protein TUM4442_36270 [Shewanella algae]